MSEAIPEERHWFGGTPADWTFDAGQGNIPVLVGGAELTMWSEFTAGTRYEDLLDDSGDTITKVMSGQGGGSGIPVGVVPRFQGPPGVTALWVDGGKGYRYLLVATDLGGLARRVTILEQTVAAQQTLLSYTAYALKYDPAAGAYPPIPEQLAGQKYLLWIGPPTPQTARVKDLHIPTKE
ncbi:hypothetical protein [Actinomadura sp. WMMA1423]|uniref:hypothetical protein n=1 Tax=Actinomadura sp. WMMA1423 TaxID=2591108 RepID=UPI0011476911|nr:hypothetical protein [Actinomadura sp. WMMA1423]